MWLDRFSATSTPSGSPPPQSRSYSPAPRRPSHLAPSQRSGLPSTANASTSSLRLSSNTSDASLHANSRIPNGSSLRREQHVDPDVPDPLDVLRSILGIPVATERSKDDDNEKIDKRILSGDHEVTGNVDFGDLSLQEYVEKETLQSPSLTRKLVNGVSVVKEDRQRHEDLHKEIKDCDDVLKSIESYLTNFQAELGAVSAEIENLQSRSVQLNAKLDNRKKVERLLGPAVEEISISPVAVRIISEGPVDENWIKALNEIETRSIAIDKKLSGPEPIKAIEALKPLLDDLKAKATERIRDYIVAQIKALRSPSVNAQILQQQTLIKYKELYGFLARNHKVLAEEIGQAYINTMRWYYNSNFTRYQQALEKLQIHNLDQHDVLGTEPAGPRRTVLSGTKTALPQHDAFNLGRRADMLKTASKPAISSYVAEEDKSAHYLETVFQNFNVALVDNVCAEYSVVTELFSSLSLQQISRKVVEIFEPTFALGHTLTKHLVEHSTDCLGVLLCVRLNQHFAFEMQRRKVPVADSYINGTNMLLWPRFQMIMDMHCESLKRVAASTNRGAAAAFSLVGGNDPSKTSLAPHSVTQRFGQFLHGILALSTEAGDDEPVARSLSRLRGDYEALMIKLAKGVGDAPKRARFLFNNYSLVLTIISDTEGKLAEEQKARFEVMLKDAKGK